MVVKLQHTSVTSVLGMMCSTCWVNHCLEEALIQVTAQGSEFTDVYLILAEMVPQASSRYSFTSQNVSDEHCFF